MAPAVTPFELRQFRAGVGALATHDDPNPLRSRRQHLGVEQAGQFGDVAALAEVAVGIESRVQTHPRTTSMCLADLVCDREAIGVFDAAAAQDWHFLAAFPRRSDPGGVNVPG